MTTSDSRADIKDRERFTSLIKEDKYLVESFKYDDGEIINGGLISRIYQQENGKLCYTLSTKRKGINGERIIYRAENMDSESHIDALLIVGKNIYTRYGLGHGMSYRFLTFFDKTWVKVIVGVVVGILIAQIL